MGEQNITQQRPDGPEKGPVCVSEVRFEQHRAALGIGVAQPRISWLVTTERQSWRQQAYEIRAYDATGSAFGTTGQVSGDQSVLVLWPFRPLQSRERVVLQVRVWGRSAGSDGSSVPSEWSDAYTLEAGLLMPSDWAARFISPDWEADPSTDQLAPLLRREFNVRPGLRKARLYTSALGVYEAQINGVVVGDHVLDPGWTSYHHRLLYSTFDVAELLHEGRNAIGAILGDGWYRGRLGPDGGRRNIYGDRLALLVQLELTYADGTTELVTSDESWCAATGPILASSLYDGETYDARLERPGWSEPGYDSTDWRGVRTVERNLGLLQAPVGPPVRRIQMVSPVSVIISPTGRTLVDFGQNLVGRMRIRVTGPAGQMITLRHAEVLEQGELATRPLRSAAATDRYTVCGRGEETWEPRFTFHGFRYVEIDGWPGELRLDALTAVVLHSDIERTGWFECSNPLLNRLHENVVWSMRGNFLSIPTDCPQRDERLGWTGDITVFAATACFLYDVTGFLRSWLLDLAAEQEDAGGSVPRVVPHVLRQIIATAVWGDAATIVPWTLYERYGDTGILEQQFESMRAWVDLVASRAGATRLWDSGFQHGDWLDPTAPPDQAHDARTDRYLIATAYFACSAELLCRAADVLGRSEHAAHYSALATEVRAAFNNEYVTPAGRLLSDAPTAYALALCFALLPDPAQRKHAGERLVALVRANGHHINTGFVGTPLICDALCSAGYEADAYRLLLQPECPSWLYPVTMGATTIWERWDSMLPDGIINPDEMTSFNHYALGAVADWLHRSVGGLAPAEPGYHHIEVAPRPGGGLTYALARLKTPYGLAECSWALSDGRIDLKVVIPPNARATVTLPGSVAAPIEVGSGTYHWRYAYFDREERRPVTLGNTQS